MPYEIYLKKERGGNGMQFFVIKFGRNASALWGWHVPRISRHSNT